ncbi:Alkaline_phosphatase [Hexamita inflata]|uniref:Alkaline phosphatase n=1 Tax=Hexamita inflata TaxID=28002 RepID=A0AA86RED7_9EUKA|nr:Alkaline phosphatase [Hexamita inflata]
MSKLNKQIYFAQVIVSALFSVGLIVDLIICSVNFKQVQFSYGPLSFIYGNQTRIHWHTTELSKTNMKAGKMFQSNELSNYHEVFVGDDKFKYQFKGMDAKFSYELPAQVDKFIVMTDIHTNNKYTSTMSTDFDFMVLCGDQSYGGSVADFNMAFKGFPTKPLIMAMGNHDEPGDFLIVNGRPKTFYQQVRNIGFYFIHVQRGTPIVDDQVDLGIEFLNRNVNLSAGTEHIFIVVHYPVYSAGYFGAHPYFTQKLEKFIDENEKMNIRAVFYGHDHSFGAFKRKQQYFIDAGVGGGKIDDLRNTSYAFDRAWTNESLHGPLAVPATCTQACYGYEYHLDSWMKYTRTEVNFEQGKIVYNVRDLDTNQLLKSYEQPL